MSEDYQHACERAELLGLPKPSEEDWRQTQAKQSENRCDDDNDGGALQVNYAALCVRQFVKIHTSSEISFQHISKNNVLYFL